LPAWEIPLDDRRYLRPESVVGNWPETSRWSSREEAASSSEGYPHTLHVLTVARKVRVKRLMEERNPARRMRAGDCPLTAAVANLSRGISTGWEDPIHYDLVLNTENLSFQSAASIIAILFP
jgi:hypothetical protein